MNSPCGICSLLLSYTHEPTSFVSFSVPCTLFSFPTINLTNGPIAYWILVCLSMWLYLDKINHLFSSMVTKPAIYSLKCNFHVRGIFLNFSASKDQSVSVTKKKIFILNYMFAVYRAKRCKWCMMQLLENWNQCSLLMCTHKITSIFIALVIGNTLMKIVQAQMVHRWFSKIIL